jgi:hypothetical protein
MAKNLVPKPPTNNCPTMGMFPIGNPTRFERPVLAELGHSQIQNGPLGD